MASSSSSSTSRHSLPGWISAASRLDINNAAAAEPPEPPRRQPPPTDDSTMNFAERSLSASGAAVLVNPLDVAKTRLQAQAAGVPYYPVQEQQQFGRRMASLGPDTAYKEFQSGAKPPGMWKTLLGVLSPVRSANNPQNLQSYRVLWTGVGAQLARDVPFSAICWSVLEPIRRRLLVLVGDEGSAASVLGANFSAGFVAGSLAAAATCPLDVVKTRRQIEKDPVRARNMTTRQTLVEVWRNGGVKGLFTGVGPRVGRAGPSVGIVVSFYEVVKYVLHQRHLAS